VNILRSNNELHQKIRDINLDVGELVVGSSLEALLYGYKNNLPIIYNRIDRPYEFEFLDKSLGLGNYGLSNKSRKLVSPLTTNEVGIKKARLWERLHFFLSLGGNIPFPSEFSSIRVSGNDLRATTANARMIKISFNKLTIFNHLDIQGVQYDQISSGDHYKVYDYFDVRSGMKHEYDFLEDDDRFVNKLMFYPSDRIDGNHNLKDVIAESHLALKELESFEYSDINARFKTLYMMKLAGIRGTRNGRDQKDRTKYKFYAIKIENSQRIIVPPNKHFSSYENISFNNESISDIISYSKQLDGYISKIIL